jgi:arsenate reductase
MKRKVLILCTGNSCRSQMAEAIINVRRGDVWEAVSAGTAPAERVHPKALQALREIGIDTQGSPPKRVDRFIGQPFDLVVTVCDDANENCPIWLGQGKREHISFPDPAKASGADEAVMGVFRSVRDDLERKLLDLLDHFSEAT